MIEKPPAIKQTDPSRILDILLNPDYEDAFSKIENDYLYWTKAKYYCPNSIQPEDFWAAIRFKRRLSMQRILFGKYVFFFNLTDYMQQLLHEFDMRFGGSLSSENLISDKSRQYFLISSLMEEAIASSQMEGALTTRKDAKSMLRKQLKPKDKSQQMILNNYNTIRFLSDHKEEKLSRELILEVHKMISGKTLERESDEGKFRSDDSIVVSNGITGEIAHEPPSFIAIEGMIQQICDFANSPKPFIHPIIKAIIIHFMISFLHPFVDGNGRTARSLFYWYMLKNGYWLTEFLSISRIIYRSKSQYENAFIYSEQDDLDLGYFIHYNMTVLDKAYSELTHYLERKSKEENAVLKYRNIPGINERQARVLKFYSEKPDSIVVSKELESLLNVSVKTIRSDLEGLVKLHLLDRIPLNCRLMGYALSKDAGKMLACSN